MRGSKSQNEFAWNCELPHAKHMHLRPRCGHRVAKAWNDPPWTHHSPSKRSKSSTSAPNTSQWHQWDIFGIPSCLIVFGDTRGTNDRTRFHTSWEEAISLVRSTVAGGLALACHRWACRGAWAWFRPLSLHTSPGVTGLQRLWMCKVLLDCSDAKFLAAFQPQPHFTRVRVGAQMSPATMSMPSARPWAAISMATATPLVLDTSLANSWAPRHPTASDGIRRHPTASDFPNQARLTAASLY